MIMANNYRWLHALGNAPAAIQGWIIGESNQLP
jgi:hypothetical protein